jgi:hypothetical protein
MPLATVTHSPGTHATYIMSKKMAGTLSVYVFLFRCIYVAHLCLLFAGNYDISKLHYEGPGDVPGAPGGGYGYDVRVEGRSSANPAPAS